MCQALWILGELRDLSHRVYMLLEVQIVGKLASEVISE